MLKYPVQKAAGAESTMNNLSPEPTFGKADKITTYTDGDYISITYIYYCFENHYISVECSRNKRYGINSSNGMWKSSMYTSDCVK